jgi:hypothetical protein
MKRLNVKIKRAIYGRRAKGTPIPPARTRTVQVGPIPGFFNWCQEMNVSSKFKVDQPVFY